MPALSSDEIQSAKTIFNLYDKDGDGKIPIEELGIVVRACGRNPTNKEVREFEAEVDPNDTQVISFKELQKVLEMPKFKADYQENVKAAFKVFDKEETGFIPVSELRQIVTTLGERVEADDFDELIKNADIDADGNLNYVEFIGSLFRGPKE